MKKLLNIITDGKYKKFKLLTLITLALFIGIELLMSILVCIYSDKTNEVMSVCMPIGSIALMCLLCEWVYYIMKFSQLKKSIRLVMQDGKLDYINEIVNKDYDTNGRIAFSDHFFYDIKAGFFIAYTSIAWMYFKKGNTVLAAINGKKFNTFIDRANLDALKKSNPNILMGYNTNNYKHYVYIVRGFRNRSNSPSAETLVLGIPDAIDNFWQWLSSKTKSKVFYSIGFTLEALFFIGLIIIANVDSPSNRIANWIFYIWCSSIFIGLISLWIGHKIEGYEPMEHKTPKPYSAPVKKAPSKATPKTIKMPIEKMHLQRLFTGNSGLIIALDKRNGQALKVEEIHTAGTTRYEAEKITYDQVRTFSSYNNMDDRFKNLSETTWRMFIEPEGTSAEDVKVEMRNCKFCKKAFPIYQIDKNGYCPNCADNWWKS